MVARPRKRRASPPVPARASSHGCAGRGGARSLRPSAKRLARASPVSWARSQTARYVDPGSRVGGIAAGRGGELAPRRVHRDDAAPLVEDRRRGRRWRSARERGGRGRPRRDGEAGLGDDGRADTASDWQAKETRTRRCTASPSTVRSRVAVVRCTPPPGAGRSKSETTLSDLTAEEAAQLRVHGAGAAVASCGRRGAGRRRSLARRPGRSGGARGSPERPSRSQARFVLTIRPSAPRRAQRSAVESMAISISAEVGSGGGVKLRRHGRRPRGGGGTLGISTSPRRSLRGCSDAPAGVPARSVLSAPRASWRRGRSRPAGGPQLHGVPSMAPRTTAIVSSSSRSGTSRTSSSWT